MRAQLANRPTRTRSRDTYTLTHVLCVTFALTSQIDMYMYYYALLVKHKINGGVRFWLILWFFQSSLGNVMTGKHPLLGERAVVAHVHDCCLPLSYVQAVFGHCVHEYVSLSVREGGRESGREGEGGREGGREREEG